MLHLLLARFDTTSRYWQIRPKVLWRIYRRAGFLPDLVRALPFFASDSPANIRLLQISMLPIDVVAVGVGSVNLHLARLMRIAKVAALPRLFRSLLHEK